MRIIATAPSRISLFGGGTDIESFSKEYGGFTVNLAINIRSHVFLSTENNTISQYPVEANPILFDTILRNLGKTAYRVTSSFDGHIGCGLGSSASATVALLGAIDKSLGRIIYPDGIAIHAYITEVKELGWSGGKQDQFACAIGGANGWSFSSQQVQQIPIPKAAIDALYPYMLLVYVGGTHKNHMQDTFNVLTSDQIAVLKQMREIAKEGFDAINGKKIERVAELLQISWLLKKQSNSKVSNERIDGMYNKAIGLGALAGKVLGAGGGGYMLFLVEPDNRKKFLKKMELEEVDFMPDYSGLSVRRL